MHVDVSSIITAIVSLILGYFAFSQNGKKSDLDRTQAIHDYVQDQNDRLNAENERLVKENQRLKKEFKNYETKH